MKGTIYRKKPKRVMPLPLSIVHLMENRVPHRRFHISAVVFVKTTAGSAIAAANFKRLPDLKIESELFLAFVRHGGNVCGRRPINLLVALIFLSQDA